MNATAIILSWNTYETVKESVARLLEENIPVILVENGSTDATKGWIKYLHLDEKIKVIDYPENVGNCVSRNAAIDLVETKYFFLLDGDIIYVPKTIEILERVAKRLPNFGIVGVHNPNQVGKTGHNGTSEYGQSDLEAKYPDIAYWGIPMAWTQYGLFLKTDQRFITEPPFDRIGYGLEDSYFYQEMKRKGLGCYFITEPMYYHEAHSSKKEIEELGIDLKDTENKRRLIFERDFGQNDWLNRNYTIQSIDLSR